MTERLLSRDPVTGLEQWFSYDSQNDTTIIRTVGDCEPIIEANKKMANDNDFTSHGIKDGMWLYASIPAAVQVKWLVEHGVDVYNKHHGPQISRLLEDPEYRYLKTTHKKHFFK